MQDAISPCRELRADARRNRGRILDAARDAFGERGLDVPLEDIADRAGVGIATLYRRFPTREALVAASFEAKLAAFAEAAEQALDSPDAWAGFAGFVEWACATQAADRGVTDLLTLMLPNSQAAEDLRARGLRAFTGLVRRAQDQGALRGDFVPEAGTPHRTPGGAWSPSCSSPSAPITPARCQPRPPPPRWSEPCAT